MLKPQSLLFMTPPLPSRRNNRLRSPASSPNLSTRSTVSSPPTIKIEDSVLESPNGSSDCHPSTCLPGTIETVSVSSPHKIFQLPPVNTWVPKGESLFTSILDQRSPQVYRRTALNTTKTASYPPTAQSLSTSPSARVSWPQESQTPQSADSISSTRCEPHVLPDDSPKSTTGSKSPHLLRKCTSFDLERSRPFPARSIMTSPLNKRKGFSFEESGVVHVDSKDVSKWPDIDNTKTGSERIIHTEEDEIRVSVSVQNAPSCESHVDSNLQYTTVDSIAGDSQVTCTQSCVSGEYTTSELKEASDNPAAKSEPVTVVLPSSGGKHKVLVKQTEIDIEKGSEIICSDGASNVSEANECSGSGLKGDLSLKEVPVVKKKVADPKQTTRVRSKSSDKSVSRTVKVGQSEKGPSKTPASTVKTAFLTSAAKLKSFGRKSPVQLLSYKSKSISIPDQSRKSGRPSSTSEINPSSKGLQRKIHQTESSPTVLVANVDVTEEVSDDKEASTAGMTRSETTISVKSEPPKHKPSPYASPASARPAAKKTVTDKKAVKSPSASDKKPEKKEKSGGGLKSSVDKSVKGSQSKVATKDKLVQVQKTSQSSKVSVTVAPKAVPESSAMTKIKKTATKSETPSPKTDKTKIKQTKRGSISSVNSDSTKPTDHFRDCCHGRRRTDKK